MPSTGALPKEGLMKWLLMSTRRAKSLRHHIVASLRQMHSEIQYYIIIIAIRIAEHYNIKYENIVSSIKEFKPIDGRQKILRNNENNTSEISEYSLF